MFGLKTYLKITSLDIKFLTGISLGTSVLGLYLLLKSKFINQIFPIIYFLFMIIYSFGSEKSTPQHITLTTPSGIKVTALFFDRNSETAMLAGQGLPGSKESMIDHAKMFENYDVLLFDYRWNNQYGKAVAKSILHADTTQRLLLDEEEEVRTALSFLQHKKNYTKIIGLGICYSNFLFAKVQANDIEKKGQGPFTHLVLDSCWRDVKSFAHSIAKDPYLPISPQTGGAPWLLKKVTDFPLIKYPIIATVFAFLTNTSIEKYLQKITTPVLFIRGKNDLLVCQEDFQALLQSAPAENRRVLETPYAHANNKKDAQMYRNTVEQFVQTPTIEQFSD